MQRNNRALLVVGIIIVGTAMIASGQTSQDAKPTRDDQPKAITMNVYALETCPVAGAKLGSMGDPVVREYDGREVRFCCPPCIETFEADPRSHFAAIDKQLIEQQLKHYPLDTCLVADRSLKTAENPVNLIHEGRLVRLCCPRCVERFQHDPNRYMLRLDQAIIKQQREAYPLQTCIVAGAELGSMGEPDEIIVGGTLVRFCCAGCRGQFRDNPAKYLSVIRSAWAERHADEEAH